jgi:flagellar protein FlaJ
MITYMTSLALANATRPEIFSSASERKEYLTSKYIAKVNMFVKKWNYSYSESLSNVAERTENEILRNMLMRYSNSIQSNVPDEEFLDHELQTSRSVYRSLYENGFENLKKWGDAYVAMLLAGTVIAITLMISIAIFSSEGFQGTLNISYGIILAICVFGIFLMLQSVPEDPKTHNLQDRGSNEQNTIHSIERILVPITIILALILWFIGIPIGWVFMLVGFLIAPLGIIGFIDDHNITLRDSDFVTFIRNYGAIMGGQATTSVHALGAINRKAFTALEPLINSVYSKMNLGLDEKQVWERFIGESGSDLISMYLNIYLDTVRLGGPAEPIGKVISGSMYEQVLLREKKDMLAKSFIMILVPMHIAMAGIFVVLYHIMVTLTGSVSKMMTHFQNLSATAGGSSTVGGVSASNAALGGTMGMFSNFPQEAMGAYIIIIITILTISNITISKIALGGDRYMYYFFAAIFCIITGLVFLIAPVVVNMFFNPAALANVAGAGA